MKHSLILLLLVVACQKPQSTETQQPGSPHNATEPQNASPRAAREDDEAPTPPQPAGAATPEEDDRWAHDNEEDDNEEDDNEEDDNEEDDNEEDDVWEGISGWEIGQEPEPQRRVQPR